MGPLRRFAQNDTAVDGKVLWARGAVLCRGGVWGLLSRVPKGEAPGAPIFVLWTGWPWLGLGLAFPGPNRRTPTPRKKTCP
jgi:hypothetical protein